MTELWLDGSRYQGFPNFAAAASVDGWVWNVDDPTGWLAKVQACHNAGKKVGLYKYLVASSDAAAQARDLLAKRDAAVAAGVPVVALAIDHEEGAGDQTLRACQAMRVVTAGTQGEAVLLYTGGWFASAHYGDRSLWPELARYLLWDAAYTGSEPAPPAPWTSIAVWQFTSSGSVPGVSGNVDMNRVFLSLGPNQQLLNEVDIVPQPGQIYMQADPRAWPQGLGGMFYLTRDGEFANEIAKVLNITVQRLEQHAWWMNGTQRVTLQSNPFPPAHTPVYFGSAMAGAGG